MQGKAEGAVMEDAVAVQQILGGKTQAYALLVERHTDYVSRAVARQVPAGDVAEVVQEAFVRGYRKLHKLKKPESFRPWLTSIAIRLCMDYWRKVKFTDETEPDELPSKHDESRGVENRQFVARLMDALKPEDRVVMNLLYAEEYTCEEIAGILGWSESKVKVRAHRARERLKERFGSVWREERQ